MGRTKISYPFCPHGTYVGGCGVDYLCHPCEMGDPLTAEERKAYEAARREWDAASPDEQFHSLPAHVLDGP